MMLSYAPQTIRRGRKLTVELNVPPHFSYHPSLASGVSAYVPVAAAQDEVPTLAPAPSLVGITIRDTVYRSTCC